MGRRILFIHSAGPQDPGQGSDSLIKYLHGSLDKNYSLMCPAMPDPDNPDYNAWKRKLDAQLDLIDDEVILIGHSLGGSVLVKYFSEIPYQKPVAGLFLIASPFCADAGWDLEEYKLKNHFATNLSFIPKIFLYHSRDDEWVPFHHMSLYAAHLPQATVRKFDDYGHIFEHPFPELINDITSL